MSIGQSAIFSFITSAALTRCPRILAVYDADPAGDQARCYLSSFSRVQLISPPAHDLSDYFRTGGDLRSWLQSHITAIPSS